MKLIAAGFSWMLACALCAAEPDWTKLDAYALDLLQRYLRIESVNPPADTRAAAELLKGEIEKHGIEVRLYPSGPNGQTNLLARLPGRDRSKKPLLLMNHLDVVPVDRKAWTIDPFGGIVKDGWIWGRGAMDMKGIGIQQVAALLALKQAGITPSRDIVMLSTADEETGGEYGVVWMINNHMREIDAEYVLDEGGFGTRDIVAEGKLVFGVAVGEKQVAALRLRARGTAGHGSQPIADNANVILVRALSRVLDQPPPETLHPVVEEMIRNIGPLAENKYTAAIRRNTIALTTLAAGVGSPPKTNVIPSASEAVIDCRLLPGVNAEEFMSEIKAKINDPRVSVELAGEPNDPGPSPSRTPLFDAIGRAIRKHHPEAIVTPMLVPHGTDSIKLRMKGITAYGLTPMVIDMSISASMHSDAERIPVTEFYKGIRIFYEVLKSEF